MENIHADITCTKTRKSTIIQTGHSKFIQPLCNITYFDSYILLTTSFDCTLTKYCLQDFIFMNHLKLLIRIWIRYVINGIKYITSKNA